MNDLRTIAGSYERIDGFLEKLRERHDVAGEDGAHERESNDQACFVLAWGQLEADIDEACRDAIRHGHSHDDWRIRRVWLLYNPDDRQLSGLSFEKRLTLVLARGSGVRRRTMPFYSVRNRIAHGTLLSERIDVSGEMQEFFRIQSSLVREEAARERAIAHLRAVSGFMGVTGPRVMRRSRLAAWNWVTKYFFPDVRDRSPNPGDVRLTAVRCTHDRGQLRNS